MDQERFDELAKQVFDTSSRRRVVGGALAGLLGATAAKVADVAAKGKGKGKGAGAEHKKGKGKGAGAEHKGKGQGAGAEHKRGKGKAKAEFICSGDNAPPTATNPCPPNTCCQSTGPAPTPQCVTILQQIGSGAGGPCGNAAGANQGGGTCRICPPGTQCTQDALTGTLRCVCSKTACSQVNFTGGTNPGVGGCCIPQPGSDDQCVRQGTGNRITSTNNAFNNQFVCGVNGDVCTQNPGNILTNAGGCCEANGTSNTGGSNLACGSQGRICENCTTAGGTCSANAGASGTCVGQTTTTTAGPTTTTTSTTTTTTTTQVPCAAPKKLCGTGGTAICCGKKQKCLDPGTPNQRCKKKK